MKRYTIRFSGRVLGAIGVLCTFTAARDANTQQEAEAALYEKYEHICVLSVLVADNVGECPAGIDHTRTWP